MSAVLDKTRDENKTQQIMEASIKTEEYRKGLCASASLVFLIDEGRGELYFRVAKVKATNELGEVRIGLNTGITGWVARHGGPIKSN